MLLEQACTVCGETVDDATTTDCDSCGRQRHETCVEFERQFDCPDCGDERWIGAVEF